MEGPFPPRFFFLPFHARSKPQLDQDAVLRRGILWANFSGKKHHFKVHYSILQCMAIATAHANSYLYVKMMQAANRDHKWRLELCYKSSHITMFENHIEKSHFIDLREA